MVRSHNTGAIWSDEDGVAEQYVVRYVSLIRNDLTYMGASWGIPHWLTFPVLKLYKLRDQVNTNGNSLTMNVPNAILLAITDDHLLVIQKVESRNLGLQFKVVATRNWVWQYSAVFPLEAKIVFRWALPIPSGYRMTTTHHQSTHVWRECKMCYCATRRGYDGNVYDLGGHELLFKDRNRGSIPFYWFPFRT